MSCVNHLRWRCWVWAFLVRQFIFSSFVVHEHAVFSVRSELGLWVRKFPAEIFRKFLEIYSNFPGNFRKFVNYLCQSAVFKSSIAKWCRKICMFLTNNSPDLYALNLCIMFRKNKLFLARFLGTSANSNENYSRYNFHSFANFFGNLRKISGKLTTLIGMSCSNYLSRTILTLTAKLNWLYC